MIARISSVERIFGKDTVVRRDLTDGLSGLETFDFGFVFVRDDHGLNFVYLVKIAYFTLN